MEADSQGRVHGPAATSEGGAGHSDRHDRARRPLSWEVRLEAALAPDRVLLDRLASGIASAAMSPVLIRMLALQYWFQVSEEVLLAEVTDRISWKRFCGLDLRQSVPRGGALGLLRSEVERYPEGREFLKRLEREGRRSRQGPAPLISIVSPVYRAEATVSELVRRIREAVEPLTEAFEIILVDDGSPDRSWDRIEECCRNETQVKGIRLSRNFGQHPAITAGLAHATGEWVVVMDCDLQDNPRYIPDLYRTALTGLDVVYTVKERRKHSAVKNLLGKLFAHVSNWLSSEDIDIADPRVGSYSIIHRRVVEAFLELQDVHRHYLVLLRWLGFPSTRIQVQHEPRFSGRSSYSPLALVRHAVNGIVSHSDRLLYLSVAAGFTFLGLSLLGIGYLVIGYFQTGFQSGWTSIVVLILLCTSIILLSVGTAGIYTGKIFEQVKQRPLYLVERVLAAPANRTRSASSGD